MAYGEVVLTTETVGEERRVSLRINDEKFLMPPAYAREMASLLEKFADNADPTVERYWPMLPELRQPF
jgi:hypothetical protein